MAVNKNLSYSCLFQRLYICRRLFLDQWLHLPARVCTQEVQDDQTLPIGRIGNPGSS